MVILEVIIGIVLIYFLFSLFASIIAERIAKFIGLRARILRRGIEHFLNDLSTETIVNVWKWKNIVLPNLLGWLNDFFGIESKGFKFSKAGEFYNLATIKYLAKLGENKWYSIVDTKPSYISRENFLISILSILDRRSTGINEWERIKFSIRNNTAHLDPETLSMFQDWLNKANDDFKVFKNLILSHFDGQMDRVNGWYKKKIRNILFFIGLILCIFFNADTIEIFKTLSDNPDKRADMVNLAIAVSEAEHNILDTLSDLKTKQDSVAMERLKKQYNETLTSIQKSNSILGNSWNFPPSTRTFTEVNEDTASVINAFFNGGFDNSEDNIKSFNRKYKVDFIKITKKQPSANKNSYKVYGVLNRNSLEKISFVIASSTPNKTKFWGFLITALALTLGAQFWFDLLKRLISIRAVGKNPDENKPKEQPGSDSVIAQTDGLKPLTDDPVEQALLQFRPQWEKWPGFVAANIQTNNQQERVIQVIFEENKKPSSLKSPVEVKIQDRIIKIPLEFAVGELGILNENGENSTPFPGSICYEGDETTWGNLAGMVYSPREGKNVALTCGHVIRKEKSSFIHNSGHIIKRYNDVDNEFKPFGSVKNLVLSSFCDAGIVSLGKNVSLPESFNITKIRSLKASDEYITKVAILNQSNRDLDKEYRKYGQVIYTGYSRAFGDFPAEPKRYYNLFMIRKDPNEDKTVNESYEESNLSNPGDSGSLIVDERDYAVGLLVGGGTIDGAHFSYGIDIQDLLDILQLEPYKS